MRDLLARICSESSLNDDFEASLDNENLILRGREQKQYSLKIYLHNIQNLYYSPAVYHNIWMYESLRNKIISDEFVILHRLIRIWRSFFWYNSLKLFINREKNSLTLRTELLDSILFKVTGKYSFDTQTPSTLINSLKDFFECLASGVLLNQQSFIRSVPAHRILLEVFKRIFKVFLGILKEMNEELKNQVTHLALNIVKNNDYEAVFS